MAAGNSLIRRDSREITILVFYLKCKTVCPQGHNNGWPEGDYGQLQKSPTVTL